MYHVSINIISNDLMSIIRHNIVYLVYKSNIASIYTKYQSNHSKIQELWKKRLPQTATTTAPLQTKNLSFKFCLPFINCDTSVNRGILFIIVPFCMMMIYCYFLCNEYCQVKNELCMLKLSPSKRYRYGNIAAHKQNFHVWYKMWWRHVPQ